MMCPHWTRSAWYDFYLQLVVRGLFFGFVVLLLFCCPCHVLSALPHIIRLSIFVIWTFWREKLKRMSRENKADRKKLLPKSLVSFFDGVMVFVGSTAAAAFLGVRLLAFVSRICNGIRTERCGVWSFIKLAISNQCYVYSNSFVRLDRPYLKNDYHLNSHNTENILFSRAH